MFTNTLERFFFVILLGLLAFHTLPAAIELTPPNLETFSFQCQDQMVKVDSTIYHLDRLRSSLKSNYFEKLFTRGDFKLKNDKILKIQLKHGEVFPSVIKLINGKELIDVLNKDNYLSLLEAMDHLEMEIDLKIFSRFIDDNLKSYSPKDAKTFELYDFIRKNGKFEYLLTSVFKKFSNNLTTLHDREMLSTLTLDHLIRIINSVETVTDEKRCKIVQTCTKWLCSDFENRLPHMAILVNSIKPGFHSEDESDENNDTSVKCLLKTNVDEKAKEKITARCLFALLAYGGKLNPTILHREDLFQDECSGYYTDYDYEEQQRREKYEEYEVCEQEDSSPTLVNKNDEYMKLKKFLENGDLYDITVRVGEKACKLHRAVLELRCGYFADIFRAEYAEAVAKCYGNPTYPCKEKEYLLDAVDQSTFDAVIDYIYFGEQHVEWNPNGIVHIFKTADILRIDSLLDILKERLRYNHEKINSSDVVEIMNCTRGKAQHDNLYLIYFCKHISSKWPEIDSLSQFCSISRPMLENMLKSPHFRPDDPHKILDICSTWVHHDVKNRYCFLPRIAQILNPHCVIDENEFLTKAPVDLTHRSQQFIRDELWNILSTISYVVPSKELQKGEPKMLEDMPAFIKLKEKNTVDVFNADLDEIASFSVQTTNNTRHWLNDNYGDINSAIMINHNLFIVWYYRYDFFLRAKFLVYNLSLKKHFLLSLDADKSNDFHRVAIGSKYTLLNCNNEIFCCSTKGWIKKFSMQLNRWMIISDRSSNEKKILFTSDGERIYRMYQVSEKSYSVGSYVVESYDFEKHEWSRESSLPLIEDIAPPQQLTIVNGCGLAISIFAEIISFDWESKSWRHRKLPMELWYGSYNNLFAQCEGRMVYVKKNKLYNFSPSNGDWELKKELPFEYSYSAPSWDHPHLGNIVPIHRPTIRAH